MDSKSLAEKEVKVVLIFLSARNLRYSVSSTAVKEDLKHLFLIMIRDLSESLPISENKVMPYDKNNTFFVISFEIDF